MLKKAVKNKKGVSEMIAYVLLIVIAVGLSVAVYAYLRVYVPKDRAQCEQDISLIVQQKSCTISSISGLTLNIQLKNKGLFNVNAAYIRMAPSTRTVREWINPDKSHGGDDSDFYLGPLSPDSSWPLTGTKTLQTDKLKYSSSTGTSYTIEIEPAVLSEDNELVICPNAVITQPITCIQTAG